jgi:uncharacterized protein YggU (UPF0235/DUF167 family)
LIRFLAARLKVPRSAIDTAITAGASSRRKAVSIAGIETASAVRVLEDR